MIHTSKQLKDKVRNISYGDSNRAKMLIRNFAMERLLERVSLSKYRDNFILKGGMLVASMIGVDLRATMDIDTTVKALPLNEQDARRFVEEICNISLEDGFSFSIKSTKEIMEEFDYPGIRLRDFYDIYELVQVKGNQIDMDVLRTAFVATCRKRGTAFSKEEAASVLEKIVRDQELEKMWIRFRNSNYFVSDLDWNTVISQDAEIISNMI